MAETVLPPAPERPLDSDCCGQGCVLPPAPERPLDSDCCGQGCVPCVMDIYQQELDIWHRQCHRLTAGQVEEDSTNEEVLW